MPPTHHCYKCGGSGHHPAACTATVRYFTCNVHNKTRSEQNLEPDPMNPGQYRCASHSNCLRQKTREQVLQGQGSMPTSLFATAFAGGGAAPTQVHHPVSLPTLGLGFPQFATSSPHNSPLPHLAMTDATTLTALALQHAVAAQPTTLPQAVHTSNGTSAVQYVPVVVQASALQPSTPPPTVAPQPRHHVVQPSQSTAQLTPAPSMHNGSALPASLFAPMGPMPLVMGGMHMPQQSSQYMLVMVSTGMASQYGTRSY